MIFIKENEHLYAVQDETNKNDIIFDIKNEKNSKINIHKDILLRNNLTVNGNLELGKERIQINDSRGYLIPSKISAESSSHGELLGFNGGRCYSTHPKDFIFLKPNDKHIINFNNIPYEVEVFKNETNTKHWQFAIPNSILNNIIYVQFYFLNIFDKLGSAEFDFKFDILNDNYEPEQKDFSNIKFKLNKNIYTTNIIQSKINTNENVNNQLCNLTLKRNKSIKSIDSINNDIYLIGIKIECYMNFYNRYV
jgi:hypothetical protein